MPSAGVASARVIWPQEWLPWVWLPRMLPAESLQDLSALMIKDNQPNSSGISGLGKAAAEKKPTGRQPHVGLEVMMAQVTKARGRGSSPAWGLRRS